MKQRWRCHDGGIEIYDVMNKKGKMITLVSSDGQCFDPSHSIGCRRRLISRPARSGRLKRPLTATPMERPVAVQEEYNAGDVACRLVSTTSTYR
jgi:hypothetical protein